MIFWSSANVLVFRALSPQCLHILLLFIEPCFLLNQRYLFLYSVNLVNEIHDKGCWVCFFHKRFFSALRIIKSICSTRLLLNYFHNLKILRCVWGWQKCRQINFLSIFHRTLRTVQEKPYCPTQNGCLNPTRLITILTCAQNGFVF